jgi:hypothetical protein
MPLKYKVFHDIYNLEYSCSCKLQVLLVICEFEKYDLILMHSTNLNQLQLIALTLM